MFSIVTGADQGCPLSHIKWNFYSADLISTEIGWPSKLKVGFIDDTVFLASGTNFEDANLKIEEMMSQRNGAVE